MRGGDSLNAARGIIFGSFGGAAIWLLIALAIWGCTASRSPDVTCVVDQIRPWIVHNYASDPADVVTWPEPTIAFADQATLSSGVAISHGLGFVIRRTYSAMLNRISFWNRHDYVDAIGSVRDRTRTRPLGRRHGRPSAASLRCLCNPGRMEGRPLAQRCLLKQIRSNRVYILLPTEGVPIHFVRAIDRVVV